MAVEIFHPSYSYRHSDCYVLGTIIELETRSFCAKFLDARNDPKGRQYDQMTQAARSGVKNLVEGSERMRTSVKDALVLIDVGRASFCELREDFLVWLMEAGEAPWDREDPRATAVYAVRFEHADFSGDINRAVCRHVIAQRALFSVWCDSPDPMVRANALLIMITRVLRMFEGLLERHGEEFRRQGGIRERMTAARTEERRKGGGPVCSDAPRCPTCGDRMVLRHGRLGDFWGCCNYPSCRGRRACEP